MYFFYLWWWIIWSAERLPNSFDSVPFNDKSDPDYLYKYSSSLAEQYFMIGVDTLAQSLVLVMTDINWIPHSLCFFLFVIV